MIVTLHNNCKPADPQMGSVFYLYLQINKIISVSRKARRKGGRKMLNFERYRKCSSEQICGRFNQLSSKSNQGISFFWNERMGNGTGRSCFESSANYQRPTSKSETKSPREHLPDKPISQMDLREVKMMIGRKEQKISNCDQEINRLETKKQEAIEELKKLKDRKIELTRDENLKEISRLESRIEELRERTK